MGSKASIENVTADMSPPNYRAAVNRLRAIPAKKNKIAGVQGEISDIFAKAEGHKVNRKGAKIFVMLDALDPPERADVMRSINGLADAAEWNKSEEDLVDQAEGTVVQLRVGKGKAAVDSGGDDEAKMQDLGEAIAAPAEAARGDDFLAQARRHLSAKGDDAGRETYTGDNSDLAGGDDEPA